MEGVWLQGVECVEGVCSCRGLSVWLQGVECVEGVCSCRGLSVWRVCIVAGS